MTKIASKKDGKNHPYFFHWLRACWFLAKFTPPNSTSLHISGDNVAKTLQIDSTNFQTCKLFDNDIAWLAPLISSYLDDYGIACGVFEKTHSSQIDMDLGHIWSHFTDLQVPEIEIPQNSNLYSTPIWPLI